MSKERYNSNMRIKYKDLFMVISLKYILYTVNIMIWIMGLIFFIVGIWIEIYFYKFIALLPELTSTALHVIIGIGTVIVVVSSVAFYAIFRVTPAHVFLYGGFLFCIYMMNAGVVASVACYRDTFAKDLKAALTQSLMSDEPSKQVFEKVQGLIECCGVNNYTDWIRLSPQHIIPQSCCKDLIPCVEDGPEYIYSWGCYKTVGYYVDRNMLGIISTGISLTFLPLVGSVLACCLASYISKKTKVDPYPII